MIVIGGCGVDEKALGCDIWEFSLENYKWNKVTNFAGTPPSSRYYHSASVFRDSIFIFGGQQGDSQKLGDLYEYKIRKSLSLISFNIILFRSKVMVTNYSFSNS